jgi:hypothetical protein
LHSGISLHSLTTLLFQKTAIAVMDGINGQEPTQNHFCLSAMRARKSQVAGTLPVLPAVEYLDRDKRCVVSNCLAAQRYYT